MIIIIICVGSISSFMRMGDDGRWRRLGKREDQEDGRSADGARRSAGGRPGAEAVS